MNQYVEMCNARRIVVEECDLPKGHKDDHQWGVQISSQPISSPNSPCWIKVEDDWWECRECHHQVSRSCYPTHFGHKETCSYSAHPIVERAEKAEALSRDYIQELRKIRPKADAYDRVCQSLGITHDILGYVNKLKEELQRARYAPLGDNHHNAHSCPYCSP